MNIPTRINYWREKTDIKRKDRIRKHPQTRELLLLPPEDIAVRKSHNGYLNKKGAKSPRQDNGCMWLRGPKTYSIFMYLWWDWKRNSCVRIFICFVTTVFPKTRNPWLTLVWLILVNICKNFLDNECFPQTWKKANIVPIHKKDDK